MDNKNLQALREQCPAGSAAEICLFRQHSAVENAGAGAIAEEIPDPYYGNLQGFENVFQLLEVSADRIERAKRRAEGAKRSRSRPRNRDRDKGYERE